MVVIAGKGNYPITNCRELIVDENFGEMTIKNGLKIDIITLSRGGVDMSHQTQAIPSIYKEDM